MGGLNNDDDYLYRLGVIDDDEKPEKIQPIRTLYNNWLDGVRAGGIRPISNVLNLGTTHRENQTPEQRLEEFKGVADGVMRRITGLSIDPRARYNNGEFLHMSQSLLETMRREDIISDYRLNMTDNKHCYERCIMVSLMKSDMAFSFKIDLF